jgi:hypothetical protein
MSQGDRPVFVVGLGRSGTSLTRSLINDHGEIAIAPEIHFLDHWMPKFRRIDIAREFDSFWTSFILGKHFPRLGIDPQQTRSVILADEPPSWRHIFRTLHAQHAEHLARPRWGEKTPVYFRHIGQLLDWFPGASIVFLLRDPRGLAASHKAVDTEWADLDPSHVARSWMESVRILSSWSVEPRVRLFRYEDIVTAPTQTLAELFRFLGSEYEPTLTDRQPMDLRENGSFAPDAAVEASHIDKWRERLSARDVETIEHICGRTMDDHGYERVSDGLGAKALMQLRLATARRDLIRAARVVNQPREATYRISIRIRRRFEHHSSAH